MVPFVANTLKPTVKLRVGDLFLPITKVDMRHNIGELPFIVFQTQLDNQLVSALGGSDLGSVKLDLSTFNQLNQAVQDKLLNGFRLEPDTFLEVTDGQGNTLRFKGYLSRPQFGMQNGQIALSFTAIHLSANLQAFNPSVYATWENYGSIVSASYLEAPEGAQDEIRMPEFPPPVYFAESDQTNIALQPRTDSLADRVATFAFGMLVNRNSIGHEMPSSKLYYTGVAMHNMNRKTWYTFRDTLLRSRRSTVIQGIAAPLSIDEGINQEVIKILQHSLNAWDVLRYMQDIFTLQINAEWDSEVYLEHSLTLSQPEGRIIQAPINSVQFTMSNMFELPVRQALVHLPISPLYGLGGNANDNPQGQPLSTDASTAVRQAGEMGYSLISIYTAYPPQIADNQAGTYYVLNPPTWLGEDYLSKFALQEYSPEATTDRTEEILKGINVSKGKVEDLQKHRTWLLDYYVEREFYNYYIRGTQASVLLPLTLNSELQIGRVYEVRSLDAEDPQGKALFTGFLASVSHHIGMGQSEGGASTQLSFTHVVVTGVKLNALIIDPAAQRSGLIRSF